MVSYMHYKLFLTEIWNEFFLGVIVYVIEVIDPKGG